MRKCSTCGVKKQDTDFRWRNRAKGIRQGRCKPCSRDYENQWYSTSPRRKKQVRAGSRKRVADLHMKIADYLRSHPCVDCGEADLVVLEFDHVRGKKKRAVATMVSNGNSWDNIAAEIKKCDVRCANCHRRRTSQGWIKSPKC